MKTKEHIADLAIRISDVSKYALNDLPTMTTSSHIEHYLIGLLRRHSTILKDIERIVRNNPNEQITSAFILFRSLLDDFIHIHYLAYQPDQNEEIIKLTASAYDLKFKAVKKSSEINKAYFEGKNPQLFNEKTAAQRKEEFQQNADHTIYFKDKENFKFKDFPNTTKLADKLANEAKSSSNAHALLVWKLLSNYVHYSGLIDSLEQNKENRQAEIDQLEEVLFYCWKTTNLAINGLKIYYPNLTMHDPTDIAGYFTESLQS